MKIGYILKYTTISTNGAMLAADKLKLNGIESNAINQTTTDGRYLQKSNNLSDVSNTTTARTNLGLGTMATRDFGSNDNEHRTNLQNDERFAYKQHTHNNILPTNIFEIPGFIEGTYHTLNLHHHNRGAFSTRVITANQLYTMPFVIWGDKNLYIDEIGIEVTTAASSAGSATIYIFEDLDGKPNNVLVTRTVTGLNTTGFKGASIDFTFNKSQLYWIGVNPSINCTMRAIGVADALSFGLSSPTATTTFISLLKALTWGGKPLITYGTWNNSERNTNAPIAVKFKVGSVLVIPDTPTNVSVVNSMIPTNVDGSWDSMNGATSYVVEYRVNGGTVSSTEVSFNYYNTGGYSNGDYFEMRVASKNSAGTSSFTNWAGVYVLGM